MLVNIAWYGGVTYGGLGGVHCTHIMLLVLFTILTPCIHTYNIVIVCVIINGTPCLPSQMGPDICQYKRERSLLLL